MVTAIVQYKLPPHIDLAACAAHFRTIAPSFRTVPGLIRKQCQRTFNSHMKPSALAMTKIHGTA